MRTAIIAVVLFVSLAQAQQSINQNIPTPQQVLGYEPGDHFSSHRNIEKYILAVQQASPKSVRVIPYGETYEGRILYLVVVSAPENIARIDEIKSNIQNLSDPRKISEGAADPLIKSTPAIAWLAYGVHGNEASGPEAAMKVLYQLAARTDDEVMTLLRNLVIIIDPLQNPDGHERYVNYQITRSGSRPIEDRNAAEHGDDWPYSRTNHYYFDLNRDWAWLTQRETQERIKVYLEWKPQVFADFHEMGYNSSYFFFPGAKPFNKNFPKSTIEWGEIYGKANAAAFDAKGWSYWSGEGFDLFYPGYGDSWPSLNGAIGMTYEQAGGVGLRVKRMDETILTLKDRIEHHFTTSFATLKATSDNREKRLRDFHTFFRDALWEGRTGPVRSYIVDPTKDPSRSARMIDLLMKQGVEIHQTTKEFSLEGLHTYLTKTTSTKKFPSGSYIIPLDQPEKRLIMTLMDPEPVLTDTFFYDISTWSLPVAYGVETYWTGGSVPAPKTKLDSVSLPAGSVVGGKATYAYLLRWNTDNAVRALVWLLQNDFKAHVAMKEFTLNGEKYPRGTIIIPISGNKADIHDRMKDLAEKFHLMITAAQSGFTESGINLGSDRAVRLRKPNIIVITNTPVSTESFGAIWSMFDHDYNISFVPMRLAQLRYIDLHDYTAIIFPDDNGNGQGYRNQLDSNAVQRIRTWIAGGGTFIGIEGGASFASASVGKLTSVKIKEKKKDEGKDAKKDSTAAGKKEEKLSEEELDKRMTVAERERKQRLESIPGTLLRVKLDPSHPLGFGYDTTVAVLKTGGTMFELSTSGYNVGMYTKTPRISGYISAQNEKRLEETPFLVHEQIGSGNVILFTDDPNFRLFFNGLNKLFLNSILLMPSIRDVTLTAD